MVDDNRKVGKSPVAAAVSEKHGPGVDAVDLPGNRNPGRLNARADELGRRLKGESS